MNFRYLGTAAAEGIPSVYCDCPVCSHARLSGGKEVRTRSGAVIDGTLMLDYNPDVFTQCLFGYFDARRVRDIFITHSHSDHCDMYQLINRSDPCFCLPSEQYTLNVYGNEAVGRLFSEACREFKMVHTEFHTVAAFTPVSVQDFAVIPLPACHAFEEQAFIYLIEKDSKRILYAHDTGWLLPQTMDYLKGKRCDMISLDTTMSFSVPEADYGHMGINCITRLKEALLSQGTADERTLFVCSHFSHNGFNVNGHAMTFSELSVEARKRGLSVAYDGMELDI